MKFNYFYLTKDEYDAQRGQENSVIALEYVRGMKKIKKDLFVEIQLVKVCKR